MLTCIVHHVMARAVMLYLYKYNHNHIILAVATITALSSAAPLVAWLHRGAAHVAQTSFFGNRTLVKVSSTMETDAPCSISIL